MKIKLIVDANHDFTWHARLVARLQAAGHAVVIERTPGAAGWPLAVKLVLDLEALLYRGACTTLHATAPVQPDPAAEPAGNADLILNLSAGPDLPGTIRLLYDGSPDPNAAVAALLDGRTLELALVQDGMVLDRAWPANEQPDRLGPGLDAAFARVLDLCSRAVLRASHAGAAALSGDVSPAAQPAARRPLTGAAAAFGIATLVAKARARLTRQLTQPDSWRIGYRRLDGLGIRDEGRVPERGYTWLPDDGRRYYADPFIHRHAGRTWMFCEEYPYATGKGVISVAEIGADGRVAIPRVVLEADCHLSYPYIFEARGEIWMMPESSGSRDLALYRAVEFPWRWERERTLLDGVALSDATPIEAEGRVWLFGSLTGETGGSSWDALGLFHAPDMFGPFEPHPLNPVLIDVASARPAGRMVQSGGTVTRVAQDCRAGYGGGITLARIDRLDPEGYAQTNLAHLTAPPAWGARGLHTIETGAGYEAIDCYSAAVPEGATA